MEANKTNGYSVGDSVMCNGHPGKVVALTVNNMIEVRLSSGVACVDPFDTLTVQRAGAGGRK